MSILLDTSVVVDCLRQLPAAVGYFEGLPGKPTVSVVTVAEVEAAIRSQENEKDADIFFGLTHVLPVSREIAKHAGSFVRNDRKSHSVELPDALIAATAEQHGLKLATLNVKHFPMFTRLKRPY